jgi:hypothetical protein
VISTGVPSGASENVLHSPSQEFLIRKLEEIAARYNVSSEALVRASIEELLARPDESFRNALDDVLTKNAELYRRLA